MIGSVVLGGCGGTPGPARVGISPEESAAAVTLSADDWSRAGYRIDWQGYPHVTRGGRLRFFHAFDDVVVTQDSANVLSVLEASSGWLRGPGIPLGTATERFVGMVRMGNTVWSCSESELHAVDLVSLEVRDRQRLDRIVSTGPCDIGSTLVFGTRGGEITAHSVTHNFGAWQNATDGSISVAPVALDSVLAVVSDTGTIVFLNAATGATVARNRIHDGTDVPLATGEGLLFIASRDQTLYAFAPGRPYYVWRVLTPAPLRDRPVYLDGVVYCVLPGEGLAAIRAASGERLWAAGSVTAGHVVAARQGTLLVWTGAEAVTLDAQTGDVITRFAVPGVARIESGPEESLFLIGAKGSVTRLRPRM